MNGSTHVVWMLLVTVLAVFFMFFIRNNNRSILVGLISWIALSMYFIMEAMVIRAATAPYSFLKQPMSDLGVTVCGMDTYVLASYRICSPYHWLMNWTFFLTGLAIFIGAVFVYPLWPKKLSIKIATICLCIFGVSYGISGIVPADIHFNWHTLSALPGMIVQIPAMVLISKAIYQRMPALAWWTIVCTVITAASLVMLFLQPVFSNLPGGLLQRILYGSVYIWLTVTAIVLWRKHYRSI